MKQQSRPHPHTQDRTEYHSDRSDKGFALSLHSHCYLKTGTFWQGGIDRFQQHAAPSARNLYPGMCQTAPKQKPNKARVNTVHLWYSSPPANTFIGIILSCRMYLGLYSTAYKYTLHLLVLHCGLKKMGLVLHKTGTVYLHYHWPTGTVEHVIKFWIWTKMSITFQNIILAYPAWRWFTFLLHCALKIKLPLCNQMRYFCDTFDGFWNIMAHKTWTFR